MKITNKHNLSIPLAMFLAHDDYDGPKGVKDTISATTLIRPLRQIILLMRNRHLETEIDLYDLVNLRMGSAMHAWIESSWDNDNTYVTAFRACGVPYKSIDDVEVYVEKRSEKKVGKYTISGKFDICLEGKVHDIKSGSVWGYVYGSNEENYIKQGSIYRWMNPGIIEDDFIGIEYIFTDWSKKDSLRGGDYPPLRVASKDYPLWTIDQTNVWIKSRISFIDSFMENPEKEPPLCSFEERWEQPTKYAYFKTDKAKRATKVFNNLNEAQSLQASNGCGRIETRVGKINACGYCPVFEVCTQKDEYIKDGRIEL